MEKTIAQIIAEQIGNGAFFMMGTTSKVADKDSLTFNVRGSRLAKYVTVALMGNDTYTVQAYKLNLKTFELTHKQTASNVYNSELHATISRFTGLALSL